MSGESTRRGRGGTRKARMEAEEKKGKQGRGNQEEEEVTQAVGRQAARKKGKRGGGESWQGNKEG